MRLSPPKFNWSSVAAYHSGERCFALLGRLAIEVEAKPEPFGIPLTTPFAEDTKHASYVGLARHFYVCSGDVTRQRKYDKALLRGTSSHAMGM
jgi:hypothetical protein